MQRKFLTSHILKEKNILTLMKNVDVISGKVPMEKKVNVLQIKK